MSGKVNEVRYQAGQPDQFTHRYEYDADNRITNVKTSRNGVIFDNDATYRYYLHGPLARVELGEDKVQGIDYIYTLQGWIKGVNSNSLNVSTDPGNDGGTAGSNQNFARDAFGYTLNYFEGDYQAIDPNKSLSANNFIANTNNFTNLATDAPSLYNGNISSMVTTIKNPTTGEVLPQMTMYRYDQLNRLKNMKAFADFNFSNNEWNYSTYSGRYQNEFTYDGNGNIETALAKNANGDVIDNQVYNYHKLGNKKQNNRLYSITDIAAITSGKDLPSGQDAFDDEDLLNNNYRYNELGELVYDKQMGIDEITWGNNGKIQSVTHSEASGKYNLKFDYNHTGKRIAKHVYNQNNTLLRSEYYTRDASDNVMAVYRLEVDEQNQEVSYRLRERHIYGSSMLGIDRLELELIDPIASNNTLNHIVGLKSYTGSNHLGNVLTTFSDKKLPVDENSDGMIDYYQPHIISSSDYAPFGAQLAERSFFSATYPNSFNDKRDDPELGDWQDYGMRMYSTWQRRFPTPDPLIVYGQEYPELSTYQFASNSPIAGLDLDGLEYLDANKSRVEFVSGNLYLKVENFIWINRKSWEANNRNIQRWTINPNTGQKDIGISRVIGNIDVLKPQLPIDNQNAKVPSVGPENNPFSHKLEKSKTKSSGFLKDDGRLKDRELNVAGGAKGRIAGFGMLGLNGLNYAAEQYMVWAFVIDKSITRSHTGIAKQVIEDVNTAIDKGMIPPEYLNKQSLVNIMNVVLQGTNNTSDKKIFEIGMEIYNTISIKSVVVPSRNSSSSDNTQVNIQYNVPNEVKP